MSSPGSNTQPKVPDQLTFDSFWAISLMNPRSPAAQATKQPAKQDHANALR